MVSVRLNSRCLLPTLGFLEIAQRHTLSTGFNLGLPWKSSAAFDLNYGSGFLNGDGLTAPTHLPAHTTFHLALAQSFGERFTIPLTGCDPSNYHYMLDHSNTFGATAFVNPTEI